ncbi:hypothetical protein K438DRAFT_1782596 [Mycena galopus ATCC 62051]|nr:hypothetical protein K438DRAFT_1782596 [Mycena galopus ATCC 62051]
MTLHALNGPMGQTMNLGDGCTGYISILRTPTVSRVELSLLCGTDPDFYQSDSPLSDASIPVTVLPWYQARKTIPLPINYGPTGYWVAFTDKRHPQIHRVIPSHFYFSQDVVELTFPFMKPFSAQRPALPIENAAVFGGSLSILSDPSNVSEALRMYKTLRLQRDATRVAHSIKVRPHEWHPPSAHREFFVGCPPMPI